MPKILDRFKKFKSRLGKWFWVILVVALLIIWRLISGSNKTTKVQTAKVTQGDLVQTVSTSGTVKADQYSQLTFPSGGKVASVWVKPGDKVVKGQSVAALDMIPLNAIYQQALNTKRSTQAAVDNVHDQVKDSASTETFAQKATRTAAEVTNDNAYDAMLAAQDNLRNAAIYAPFAGIIDTASPSSPGISVLPGAANYTIVNPDTVYFDAEVEETDLPHVAVGQKVNIKLDAYPDENFQGQVSYVGLVAFTSSTGGNAYHIRISLPKNENLKFRVGMQGDVDIIFATTQNVLKVSSSSVVTDGGKSYVWVIQNAVPAGRQGKVKKADVAIGVFSTDETEIKSGLNADQEVVDNPPSNMKAGQKVST